MADSTIDSELITLCDNWPGAPLAPKRAPRDDGSGAFIGADHHNVATAAYPVGTKYQVYNTGVSAGKPGWATFAYLQIGTQNAAVVIAVKSVVVQDSATVWYQVTNDPDDCVKLPTGLAAIALSAMTNAYYGWFWCGGVCPEEFVSGLAGNYATQDGLVAGQFTAHNLDADEIGIDVADTAGEGIFGYAIADDA